MTMAQTFHPYMPQDAPIHNYAANTFTTSDLLVRFGTVLGSGLVASLLFLKRNYPRLALGEQAVCLWFILCGSLHCFFEGYFLYKHKTLASSQDLLAQLWKEYALSDSRYLTSDPFMLCVEAITVTIWGPLSFLTALSIARTGNLRHPLQIIVSVAHLYGVALYYSTCYAQEQLNGIVYSRPEFQYYWVYYVGFNAPWVVVPAAIILSSISDLQKSTTTFDKVAKSLDERKVRLRAAFE